MKTYSNPFGDSFNVDGSNIHKILILDSKGYSLISYDLYKILLPVKIDVRNLSAGMCFIRCDFEIIPLIKQ